MESPQDSTSSVGSSGAKRGMMSRTPLKIGEYRLGETLGVGSFGKVKLAEHELTGHQVAVKIVNRKKIKNLRMDEKIRREIQILKLFRHPHIIKLYEVIETPTDIFMIMEYVSGGELFEYIVAHGRLLEDQARRFFQQIIAGVEYCHAHRVVHRDLKPENLLLDAATNSVKIGDFGLSNIMNDGDFLKTSCGSPNYAAPEVISGQLYAGPEVDVWSCGVILYALLCARLPFDDDYIPNLFKKIKGGVYKVPTHVSEACANLIQRMLVVDPLKRITIPEIRQHPWFQTNLPAYLAHPPAEITSRTISHIDENILAELCQKLSVDREKAIAELTKGEGEDGEVNKFVVAYHLIEDHRKDPTAAPVTSRPSTAAAATTTGSSTGAGQTAGAGSAPAAASGAPGGGKAGPSWNWNLGISSSKSAGDIMRAVFAVLKKTGFAWKTSSPYSLRCRSGGTSTAATTGVTPPPSVKIALQLFKVRDDRYLVDLKYLEGPVFFDEAVKILLELQAAIGTKSEQPRA